MLKSYLLTARRERLFAATAASGVLFLSALFPTTCLTAQQGKVIPDPLPPERLIPPPEPAVRPIIVHPAELDANQNKLDDEIERDIALAQALPTVQERAEALSEFIRVELVFAEQITRDQIDAFLRLGGNIDYVYQSVSYGWNGTVARGLVQQIPGRMGPPLVAVIGDRPLQLHLKEATQNGRVRPVWVPGFAGSSSGFSGNTNITIAILDTGIDDSHTDLSGRQEYWYDYTDDNEATPRDIVQHGSHVAGIALGTGEAIGASPTQVLYTDSGNLSGVSVNSFYPSPIHIPAGSAILNSTATWLGGGDGTLHGAYREDGSTGSYYSLGSSTGPSPLTRNNSFTATATRHYSAALLSNGSMTSYAVVNTATFSEVADGFNALRGVAPSCKWAGGKVFKNDGTGSSLDIYEAVDGMVTQRIDHNVKVANMSLGIVDFLGRPAEDSTLRAKVNTMVSNGIVAVCSAGNDGPGTKWFNQVGDPGRAGLALTVAASNSINQLTEYSSSGFSNPGTDEDYKPDLMAPGGSQYYSYILSVDSNDADAESTTFADQRSNDYYNIFGTSMSSPFAAGAAALVIDAMQQSGVTWDFYSSTHSLRVKMLLCATATESNAPREVGSGTDPTLGRASSPKDRFEGYGLINPDAAIEAVMLNYAGGTLTGSTEGGYYGRRAWGRNVNLQSATRATLTLDVPDTADYDLYLHSGAPDTNGNPVILASSSNAGLGSDESIDYVASSTETGYLVIKRVSGSGSWTLTGNPTAVELISFAATRYQDGVLVEWCTGYEASNLGFHVYREKGGERVRMTPELVAGSALFAGARTSLTAGLSYSWWDILPEGTGQVQYSLEDVDLNGQRTWHGPVRPVESGKVLEEPLQPAFLSEIGRARAESERALARVQEVRRRLAEERPRGIRPTGELLELTPMRAEHHSQRRKPTPMQQQVQWELAAGPAVKVSVREEGWYRVTQPELVSAGLDLSVNPGFLQLFVDGEEQPLLVSGESDRRFDPGDAIEFYGVAQDTPWTDTQIYWLVEGDRPGKRVGLVEGRTRGKEAADSFLFTVECKERAIYFAALKNGDAENFFGPVVTTEPVDQILNAPHLDSSPPGDALLEVALQGVTEQSHRVAVFLSDIEVSELTFEGQASGLARLPVPQCELLEGDNLVTLAARGGQTDVSLVDFIRLTYWHTYTADGDSLRFSALGGQQLTVAGFSNPQIRVVDITDPGEVKEVLGLVKAESGGYAVTVKLPGLGQKTLLAFADSRVKKPVGISPNQPSRWHQGIHEAELVIISHRAFIESAGLLKSLREGQGWKVALIDVEDLYDEFSFGAKSPYAIREFLVRAMNHWKNAPRFVLLIGDASFDPRNYLGFGDYDFVPTKLIETAFLETASDDWFADMDGDGLPEMAVGRLPVRNSEQAAGVVWKILGYEQAESADWARNVLLVADKNDIFDFESASAEVRALLPEDMKVQEIFRGQKGNAAARSELLERLNEGQLLVNYIGHGSVEIWRGSLLASRDAGGLVNIPRLPFVMSMTCLNGFFHDLYTECLAEALLKAEEGGAMAVWTSSGLTWPDGQVAMNKELVKALFNGRALTIGEATLAAKAAIKDQDIRKTWILFGDPTTRLR